MQDAAAAIPATLLGDVRGRRVIDLCAAPGGKTAQLAAAGAKVTAVDRSRHRLRRLTDNLRRLDLCAEVIAADALTWTPLAPADAVLLDAPCSATGTIRRHPDVPIIKTRQDVAKLVTTQTRLLRAARRMVKPGGILVYCVCSLQSAEGQDLVAAQLAEDDGLRRDPIGPKNVGGLEEMVTWSANSEPFPVTWRTRAAWMASTGYGCGSNKCYVATLRPAREADTNRRWVEKPGFH